MSVHALSESFVTDSITELNSAIAHHQAGRLEEAEAAYRRVIKSGLKRLEPYTHLALLCAQDQRPDQALPLWKKALKLAPDNAELHMQLAATLKLCGKTSAAINSYQRALSLNPQLYVAHYNLANLLQNEHQHTNAIDHYRQTLQLQPQLAEAHYNLGSSLRTLGQLDDAKVAFERALSIKPDYPQAHNNLGNTWRDLGDLNLAIEHYQLALQLQPNDDDALYNLGNALFEAGEFDRAAPFFSATTIRDSAARALFCHYRSADLDAFKAALPAALAGEHSSPLVAALSCHYASNVQLEDPYRFFPNPMRGIYHSHIPALTDSNNRFREDLLKTLHLSEISERKQGRLHHGMQSAGNLFDRDEPALTQLADLIREHLAIFRTRFADADGELIKMFPQSLVFESSWYLKMQQGGHLSSHIHETGWVSGVLYLQLPEREHQSSEGDIEFSTDGDDYPRLHDDFPSRIVHVAEGDIVLFPSSLFHRTLPFSSDRERICIAFDLSPPH